MSPKLTTHYLVESPLKLLKFEKLLIDYFTHCLPHDTYQYFSRWRLRPENFFTFLTIAISHPIDFSNSKFSKSHFSKNLDVFVGLSGGADSIALVHYLNEMNKVLQKHFFLYS